LAKKNGGACGAAKFREETSKKADSAAMGRIAAMHNLGDRSFACKRYFAMQHCRQVRAGDAPARRRRSLDAYRAAPIDHAYLGASRRRQ
jgi:uncharacterized ParB-like nuclease family protein